MNVYGSDLVRIEADMNAMAYTDNGAVCTLQGADISMNVRVEGLLYPRTREPGTYTVNYECADNNGIDATPVSRTVVVRDTTCPTCTINVPELQLEASFPYSSDGAQC